MNIHIEGSAGQEQPTKALLVPCCVACDSSADYRTQERLCFGCTWELMSYKRGH